jgi:hypothetical protein
MEEKDRSLSFTVTMCLGYGDGFDVYVCADVSDEEYELIKKCYEEGLELNDCEGLEALVSRIEADARDEADSILYETESDEEIDFENVQCLIQYPDEIDNDA